MAPVTTVTVLGGRPVVRKTGTGEDAAAIRGEVAALRAADHAGVVRLVGDGDEDGAAWLATELSGRTALAGPARTASPLSCLAQVAATLADLHGSGVVHGRLTADHIVVTGDGTARLCSLAGRGGALDDVVALAELARQTADWAPATEAVILRTAAGRVLDAAPDARPPMRAMAQLLAAGGSRGRSDGRHHQHGAGARAVPAPAHGPRRRPCRRWGRLAAAVAAVGLVVGAGVAATMNAGGPRSPGQDDVPGGGQGDPPLAEPVSAGTAAAPPVTRMWPPCPPGGPDADGDGCGDAVTLDGTDAVAGRTRWTVAAPGEIALLGDWDCDGEITAAVVRPATGSVWVHDGWAAAGIDVEARGVAVTGPAARAETVDLDGDGCHEVAVTLVTGAQVTVAP